MSDTEKLHEKAERYLQKQKFEAALETYLEIHKLKPTDEEALLNLGDLCHKLNRTAESLRFQAQLADQYIKRNDISKAIATCRKILKLAPNDAVHLIKLGNLLEKVHKENEALEAYREALELLRKSGGASQALACLDRIVKLDPSNLDGHVEHGEIADKAGQPKVAAGAFLRAAQLARNAAQEDRWAELAERAYQLDPGDEGVRLTAAEAFVRTGRGQEAVGVLEPVAQSKPDDMDVLDLLVQAYLLAGEYEKAEAGGWKLFQTRPQALELMFKAAEGYAETGQQDKALRLVEKLQGRLAHQRKGHELVRVVEKIYEADETNLKVLETLTALYNETNDDEGLRRALVRLFNLQLAGEQCEKAADTLERIIDVDPYGAGHQDRLLNLEGHIDKVWYDSIASRLQVPASGGGIAGVSVGPKTAGEKEAGLDDLIVEGEMYLQYQIASKLKETLEKIDRLYPGAHKRSTRLRELYDAAGFTPTPVRAAPRRPEPEAPKAPPAVQRPPQPSPPPQPLEDFKKISEMTASIYRESTPQGVMQVGVNEIGRALRASRCWGALGSPERPPALTVEYCSPSAVPSDMQAALKLYEVLIRQAAANPDGWMIEDAAQSPVLAQIVPQLQELGIESLLAVPLMDKEEVAGLLIAEQCKKRRAWTSSARLLLKAVATQLVVSVNNTKLRRLVRSLGGTDEETGLLPRSSYVDCLLAEAARAKELSQPLSVCLLEPEDPAGLVKALGDAGVQRYFQQVGKAILSNLRQNDVAIRYSPCSIAAIFPDTALPQGGLAVEKLRRVISQVQLDGISAPNLCVALCDVQLGSGFDAVDGVTELINRLESTLERARNEGGKRVLLSHFED